VRERHAFLLLPRCSLLGLAGASEVLRVGNEMLGGRALEVLLLSRDGAAVSCAGGETLAVNAALDAVGDLSGLHVVADTLPTTADAAWAPSLSRLGIAIDRRGGVIGGIGSGAAWWAQAGLMDGYRCCVSALHAAEAASAWPRTLVTTAHHVHDRNRWSCAGGPSSIELIIRWFGSRHGERLQLQLLAHFGLERLRQEHERQSEAAAARAGGSAKLAEAVALMQANLGEPLSTEDIAGLVGVSRRQLERLFKQHLDTLPSRWYLEQRLQRARRMLQQSSQSILQIGLGCGFTSGAHFSNAYRGFFGRTPRDERSARAAAWRQAPLAGTLSTSESPHSAKERT
jgi:transcriptional regulator GlxA family with amidase domain